MFAKGLKLTIATGVAAFTLFSAACPAAAGPWGGNSYTPIGNAYHTPVSRIEIDNFPKEIRQYNLIRNTWLEEKIQKPLLAYNPRKIFKAKGKYDDGLRQCYTEPVGTYEDSDSAATYHGGGYISVTRGRIEEISAPYYGQRGIPIKDYNIYALSALASDYAHECGHWYYGDAVSERRLQQNQATADRDAIAMEERADAFGIRLLEDVPHFSVGGDLIAMRLTACEQGWNNDDSTEHPSNAIRWDNTYRFIKNRADNRVYFRNPSNKNSNVFYIRDNNHKEWKIAVPVQYRIEPAQPGTNKRVLRSAEDRAAYVMGQVAWAIKHDIWDKDHLHIVNANEYFHDLPNTNLDINVLVAKISDKRWKIIDWFILDDNDTYYNQAESDRLYLYLQSLLSSAGFDI